MRSPRRSAPTSSARAVALRLLSRRDYTTAELREKLADREYPADEIDQTVGRLTDEHFLDDRRVAAAHVRRATAIKGRGRLRIARELEARGLGRPLIRELLSDLPPEDEGAAIARFLQRKRLPARLGPADRRRLFQQLLRRGFPAEAIAKALGTRGAEDDEA